MKNIFDILSVADKELVHSAMLQFFIESDNWKGDFFEFLALQPDKKKDVFYPKLEYSDSFQKGTKKKRIRFDLVLFEDKKQTKPILIIENKFKATPTVEQLKLYDEFITKQESFGGVPKILFVFSMDSVSVPIIKYCNHNEHKWKIIPYVKEIDEKQTLFNFLNSKIKKIKYCPTDEKEKLFLLDYISHLEEHQDKIIDLIKPVKGPWRFPKYNEKITRFHYLQFLLFIQKEIYDRLVPNPDFSKSVSNLDFPILASNPDFRIKFSLNNDGGRNKAPSVNFWLDSEEEKMGRSIHAVYVSIDGDKLRLGFHYVRPDKEEVIKNFIVDFIKSTKSLCRYEIFNFRTSVNKKVKLKKDDNTSYSVYSIFTGSLGDLEVIKVLDELPKIISSYFKDSLKFL